jgi:hypothetical protein
MDTSIEPPRRFVQATASILEKTKCMAGSVRGALEVAVHDVDPSCALALDDPSAIAIFDSLLRVGAATLHPFARVTVNLAQGHRLNQRVFRAPRCAIERSARLKPHAVYRHRSCLLDREASSSPPFSVAAIELKVSTCQVPTTH